MEIWQLVVLGLAGILGFPTVKEMLTNLKQKKREKIDDIEPDGVDAVRPKPDPSPIISPKPIRNATVVDIVHGWHCFKEQCEEAKLHSVVNMLDDIFPMLIKTDDDAVLGDDNE